MALLEVNNLSMHYGPETALNNVSFNVEDGKIVGLLGPNGSGKTTFIKLLNGLLPLKEGTITINGYTPGLETKKLVSYLPERTYLDNNMTPNECIKFFKDFYDDFDVEKAQRLIEVLGVNPKKKLKTLSKGMKEKVQLVLVMSRTTKLYVLDEPIAGVDPASRDYILNLIKENLNPNSSMIICTHLIADIEDILDDVIFLSHGNVLLHDTKENVMEKYEGSVDKAFREVFRCF